MMTTRTIQFTSNSSGFLWTAPPGVSAVWLTMTGGGLGSTGAGDGFSFLGASGAGGSAELCINRPISVVPGNTYAVTVGVGSAGVNYGLRPVVGTDSKFDRYSALAAPIFLGPPVYFGPNVAGPGGGSGGSVGGWGGGGFDQKGKRECCNFGGGAGGSYNSFYYRGMSESDYTRFTGVLGGVHAYAGTEVFDGSQRTAGGPAGGAIWGANNGGDAEVLATPGNSQYYGSSCGGTGEPAHGTTPGARGSDGVVILMWIEK